MKNERNPIALQSAAPIIGLSILCVSTPYLEGALPSGVFAALLAVACLLGVAQTRARNATKSVLRGLLISLSVSALTICAADLVLRPFTHFHSPQYSHQGAVKTRKLQPVAPEFNRTSNPQGIVSANSECGDLANMSHMDKYQENKLIRIRFDSFGYRNDRPADPNQIYDAIVIGDSFGYGKGTTQDKIWARLLESRYGMKTYNLSKNGGDPWDEYLTLAAEIDRLKTRPGTTVVWAIYTGNDITDLSQYDDIPTDASHTGGMTLRRFRAYSPIKTISSKLFQQLSRSKSGKNRHSRTDNITKSSYGGNSNIILKDFPNGKKVFFFSPYITSTSSSYEEVVRDSGFRKLDSIMSLMKRLAESKELALKMILIPSKEEVYSWVVNGDSAWTTPRTPGGMGGALSESARKRRIDFLDLKPFFIDASKNEYEKTGRLLWWYDDSHVNEQGHALIASLVHDKLLSGKSAK